MDINFSTKKITINGSEIEISEPSAGCVAKLAKFKDVKPDKLTGNQLEEMILTGIEVVQRMGVPSELAEKLPVEPLYKIAGAFNTSGN